MARVSSVISALFWLCLRSGCSSYYSLQVGDPCPTRGYRSSCQPAEQCSTLGPFIRSGRLSVESVLNCGYTIAGEKICCPLEDAATTTTTTTTTATTTTTSTTTTAAPTTESPPWLSLFKTSREYVERSVAEQAPASRDSIIFPDTSTLSGAACQTPLYEGSCETASRCRSLKPLLLQQRLHDDDIQTCRDGTLEEIICCPANLPAVPRGQVGTATRICLPETTASQIETRALYDDESAAANAARLLPHYKHLAALAYPNAAHDGYVHSCTALVLTPQLLVSGADCGRPSHAVFGVADMRDVDDEEDFIAVVDRVAVYRDDLAVLRLTQPLPVDQSSAPHISLAPMCTQFELTRLQISGQLLATAWAKGNDHVFSSQRLSAL
ncbi:uncharacterized protein Dmoj_GI15590, isoform B [Drosophila mojavensis]|uniref:Uncharacterized protein, isoform B n=1 Tax=Drosophila mojavensis TaxID=7230 RepID=A0A0Q9WUP5_DROMO|nr:uncharacterized protein Dmoj_GI15590, isoform B [Drosophila mojavensis]